MNPRVTIGIPTFNRARVVDRAIESVRSQTYKSLDVVVVDDGSTDATRDVLLRYEADQRVQVIQHDQNRGVASAKNTLLDAMSGELGGILDSDDELLPGAIQACVRAFEGQGDGICQVFGNCIDADSGATTGHGMTDATLVRFEDAVCGRFRGEYWQLFRRGDLGTRRFHPDALTAEGLVWHAMLREKPGYYLGEPVRRYDRGGADRVSTRRPDSRTAYGRMMAYKVYLDEFGRDLLRLCPARFAELAQELAKWQARCGRRAEASATLARAVRASPGWGAARAAAVVLLPRALTDVLSALRDQVPVREPPR
jgi:glycosyltransferase involved in cell wall biosynthesis